MRKQVECDAGAVARLLEIMARLRDPDTGCPWDLQQNFSTIAPYTLEEAYEVAEAIQRNDAVDLCDELGELLRFLLYRFPELLEFFNHACVVFKVILPEHYVLHPFTPRILIHICPTADMNPSRPTHDIGRRTGPIMEFL